MSTRVIAIEQQKGGVGKTDVTKNISGALAAKGRRVGVIDWDPQGDLTRMFGMDPVFDGELTLPSVLLGKWTPENPYELFTEHSSGVWVVRNSLDMHVLEPNLYQVRAREHRLAKLVEWIVASKFFDDLLFDCPPALGLLTDNATVATDKGDPESSGVLAVAAAWPIIFGNLELLLEQLRTARQELSIRAQLLGLIVNMYDVRKGLMETQSHNALTAREDYLYTVKMRAVISEAAAAGQPVEQYSPTSDAAKWYRDIISLLKVAA